MLGVGTQTAAIATCARWSPYPTMKTDNYEYDGTSWSAGGAIPANRAAGGGTGTQTAANVFAGFSTIPYGGFYNTPIHYDGSSWTVGTGTINQVRMLCGASGTQTAALMFGGLKIGPNVYLDNTETYNGTAWTEIGNLTTARTTMGSPAGTNTTALAFAGGPAPVVGNATEEYNDPVYSIKTVTVS